MGAGSARSESVSGSSAVRLSPITVQILTSRSTPELARRRPSGLKATPKLPAPLAREQLTPGVGLPQPHQGIIARGRQQSPVWTVRHTVDPRRVAIFNLRAETA